MIRARLEEAQRLATYAEMYRAIARSHELTCKGPERVRSCNVDAERSHGRAVAIVFGPWPELPTCAWPL